jgi:hypothetical protein
VEVHGKGTSADMDECRISMEVITRGEGCTPSCVLVIWGASAMLNKCTLNNMVSSAKVHPPLCMYVQAVLPA